MDLLILLTIVIAIGTIIITGLAVMDYRRKRADRKLDETSPTPLTDTPSAEDKALRIIRGFTARWDQYIAQSNEQRWQGGSLDGIQQQAMRTAEALTSLVAEEQDELIPPVINQINQLANELRQFGGFYITIGTTALEEMEKLGKAVRKHASEIIEDYLTD